MQDGLSPESAAPLKAELAAKSPTYLNSSMAFWGTHTASPGGLSPYWSAAYLSWAALASNWTVGLFSPISPSSLKHQLTAIPSHPVAEEKGEYTGKGQDPLEDCVWHVCLVKL